MVSSLANTILAQAYASKTVLHTPDECRYCSWSASAILLLMNLPTRRVSSTGYLMQLIFSYILVQLLSKIVAKVGLQGGRGERERERERDQYLRSFQIADIYKLGCKLIFLGQLTAQQFGKRFKGIIDNDGGIGNLQCL